MKKYVTTKDSPEFNYYMRNYGDIIGIYRRSCTLNLQNSAALIRQQTHPYIKDVKVERLKHHIKKF